MELIFTAPGTYDPKHLDTSRKVTIRQRLNDFKPDQTPGKQNETSTYTYCLNHGLCEHESDICTAPGTYDPKHVDVTRKVTMGQKLKDFRPDEIPG